MIRTFEREYNVEWRNGRVYFDEKKEEKMAGKKKANPKTKKPTPSLPLPAKSPQPKTGKIVNSSVNQTNVLPGKRERKKKVILDL